MEEYINKLGLSMTDVDIDRHGRLFILIEGQDANTGRTVFKEIEIPEEYQTFENINLIKNGHK